MHLNLDTFCSQCLCICNHPAPLLQSMEGYCLFYYSSGNLFSWLVSLLQFHTITYRILLEQKNKEMVKEKTRNRVLKAVELMKLSNYWSKKHLQGKYFCEGEHFVMRLVSIIFDWIVVQSAMQLEFCLNFFPVNIISNTHKASCITFTLLPVVIGTVTFPSFDRKWWPTWIYFLQILLLCSWLYIKLGHLCLLYKIPILYC